MRSLFLLSLLLTGTFRLVAQSDSALPSSRFSLHPPLTVFFEPSAWISGWNSGSLRGGIELPLGRQLALQLGVSRYGAYAGSDGWGEKVSLKWYNTGDDFERLPEKQGAFRRVDSRIFFALEYAHKAHSYQNKDSVVGAKPPYSLRTYHVDKEVHSLSLQWGGQYTLRCGIFYEYFLGAGLRMKTAHNDLEAGESDHFYHWHEGFVAPIADGQCYKCLAPHISAGFRIGYRFR